MEINFFAVENFTAYGRKNIFIRMKIKFHTDENGVSCVWKFYGIREEVFQHAGGRKFSCGKK